jgi:uncharacterized protein (DUF2132 family)
MVQLNKAAAVLIASLSSPFVAAFSPSNPAARKVELARAKVENEYLNMVEKMDSGMKMVSGGAAAEEYYEGKLHRFLSLKNNSFHVFLKLIHVVYFKTQIIYH